MPYYYWMFSFIYTKQFTYNTKRIHLIKLINACYNSAHLAWFNTHCHVILDRRLNKQKIFIHRHLVILSHVCVIKIDLTLFLLCICNSRLCNILSGNVVSHLWKLLILFVNAYWKRLFYRRLNKQSLVTKQTSRLLWLRTIAGQIMKEVRILTYFFVFTWSICKHLTPMVT